MDNLLQVSSFDSQDLSNSLTIIQLSEDDIPGKYAPIIAAFRRFSNIICDACGSKGHHASNSATDVALISYLEMFNAELRHTMPNMAHYHKPILLLTLTSPTTLSIHQVIVHLHILLLLLLLQYRPIRSKHQMNIHTRRQLVASIMSYHQQILKDFSIWNWEINQHLQFT